MFCARVFFVVFLINLLIPVKSHDKSSLTFVIDDTGSMGDDIDAVKDGVNAIFETVMNSNASQIEDFVLVTFNDPDARHRITTRDRDNFKKALAEIDVDGGGDCPEMSMSGIQLGLENSRPGSLLYVFTDASAKDPEKKDLVQHLAIRKECQVVFVLTGDCDGEGDERVYYKVAQATYGQVFHLDRKSEVKKILKYVEKQINNRKAVIANTKFPPGTHKLNYEVDSKMKELVISVSGTNPALSLIDPEGEVPLTEDIVRTSRVAIVKVTEVKPGTYTAEVTSSSETSVVVTAETTLHFQHGFSLNLPKSTNDAVSRPIPDQKSYLSIKLNTKGPGDIKLDTVQILDTENNIINEKPLKVGSKKDQFYFTEAFIPPNTLFRIAIKGHDRSTGEEITRLSLTPIEPQVIDTFTPTKAPVIKIEGDNPLKAKYNEHKSLSCKISAFPKPDVIWERDDGAVFKPELSLLELPYDYISVLDIDQVTGNNTYTCKANNDNGSDSKEINVQTDIYFTVLKKPEGASIDLDQNAVFECKIDAQPPAEIKWYKDGKKIKEDRNVQISDDKSTLTINKMQPINAGKYVCLAKNSATSQMFKFIVQINKTGKPVIDKTNSTIPVQRGSDVEIPCKLIEGNPKPRIRWFFKKESDDEEVSVDDFVDDEILRLDNVTLDFSGIYRCEARNGVGSDYHNVEVIVEHPPEFDENEKATMQILARKGDKVKLPCMVTGKPEPTVKWMLNDKHLNISSRYIRGYYDDVHSISFTATLDDTGTYTCVAENKYGVVNRTIHVRIMVPPYIEAPEKSLQEVNVGSNVALACNNRGFPEPRVEWIFHSLDAKKPPETLRFHKPANTLFLPHIQLNKQGFYTCIAANDGGSYNITYEMKVVSPPIIENVYPEKTFKAVIGDLTLNVPCKASGNPKPEITWIKDGLNKIAAGTDWYDIQEDGTLIIKNVDMLSTGTYLCQATNRIGLDEETYEVVVEAYPESGSPSETILIEAGKSKTIKCTTPHKRIDSVRWFKNGKQVGLGGDYTIRDSKISDAGIYTCRVSDFAKSRSGHTNVKIGYKPIFRGLEEEIIDLEEGVAAVMDCEAVGEPRPKISWWHNGKTLPSTEMTLVFDMTGHDLGHYFCLVENDFGKIVRRFQILSKECMVNMETDMQGNQPMITTRKILWPFFSVSNGYMKISPSELIGLFCPSGFKNFPKNEIYAECDRGSNFTVEGNKYRFSDLQCKEELKPIMKRTSKRCLPSHSSAVTIRIGFEVRDKFLDVYNVCFDVENKVPLFTQLIMPHTLANVEPKNTKWHNNELVPLDFDSLYNCDHQKNFISRKLGKWFHKDDKCCFAKRQLVNPKDVLPGVSQTATYNHLNLVPQWSTCNSQNWDSVERKVRLISIASGQDLIVFTGTARKLKISDKDLQIYDARMQTQPISQYIWKVVLDPNSKASVAIVQINVPDLTLAEAYSHIACRDICNEISWLKSRNWRDVNRGYVFCCSIFEFQRAFGYTGVFHGASGKVLHDVSVLPDHSLA